MGYLESSPSNVLHGDILYSNQNVLSINDAVTIFDNNYILLLTKRNFRSNKIVDLVVEVVMVKSKPSNTF